MKSNSLKKTVKVFNPIFEVDYILNKEVSELSILLWDIGIMTLMSKLEKRYKRFLFEFPIQDAEWFINVVCNDHEDQIYCDVIMSKSRSDWRYDIFVNDFNESINKEGEIEYSGPPDLSLCVSIRFPQKDYKGIISRIKKWKDLNGTVDEFAKLRYANIESIKKPTHSK